ncbi:fimbria/pilus outer membrane usher protein [Maricaulis sp.]|uniref:fimbria/pilus outer membrane usher protein n=1 Tax=Maricaulis sp. TaxID=1486257 RepID=UPI0025C11DC4|nr:fimbria/pilus outer membrane usher protein [Maricaulis sp.]
MHRPGRHAPGRFVIGLLACALSCLVATGPGEAARLQANEQLFLVDLPLIMDGRRYPAITVETSVTTVSRIDPDALLRAIGPALNDRSRAALEAKGVGLVPVADLAVLGLTISLEPRTLTARVEIALENRAATAASLARDWVNWDETAIRPAPLAFGVTGALTLADTLSDSTASSADLRLDGFINFGGLEGVSVDWGGRSSLRATGDVRFTRDRIIAFTENSAQARRFSAGDLAPQLGRSIGLLNLAGVAVETNYRDLQPTRNIRPTGDRSLVLDRPSTVEVYVNGALIDRFAAGPGPVDLRDIPLANTSNDIVIIVEDDLGRREADRFSLSANIDLLASGLTESVWAVGFARDESKPDFAYDNERPVFGGSWRRGLSDSLTASASVALDADYRGTSGTLAFPFAGGVAQTELTWSDSDGRRAGSAIGFAFTGGPYWAETRRATLNLRLDHYSAGFVTLNTRVGPASTRWSLGGDMRLSLTDTVSMSLGAQYRDSHIGPDRSRTLSASVNRRFGEILVSASARHSQFSSRDNESGLFLTVSRRFSDRQFASASHDSLGRSSRVDWRRGRGETLPFVQARAAAIRRPDSVDIRGAVDLVGARAGLQLSADHQASRTGAADRSAYTLRLQSGLAWSDGQLGIGRDPGRGFIMVDRHPSLENAELAIAMQASPAPVGRADRFGPAIISVDAPYRPVRLRVDASGLEPGYDIGPGQYSLISGSSTGTRITVGTPAFRTAIATLTRDGEPPALQYGLLTHLDSGTSQAFFTNRTGRAAFNALLPGRYAAHLQSQPRTVYRFTIGTGASAYVDLGRLEGETSDD